MLVNRSKKNFFCTAILLFTICALLPLARAAQPEANAAIATAKEQILTCYQAANDAEEAGANITALAAVLNDAGTLFSRAEFAYSIRDFDTARNLAIQSQSALGDFVSEANNLKETATQQRSQDFLINVVGSLVGAFAVLLLGVAAWVFLRKKTRNMEQT